MSTAPSVPKIEQAQSYRDSTMLSIWPGRSTLHDYAGMGPVENLHGINFS